MKRFAGLSIAIGILAAAAGPVRAEPPTGFADLPWGTPSNKVYEYTRAQNLCTFLRDDVDVARCGHYALPGVGEGGVSFYSLIPPEADAPRYAGKLAGYIITLPHSSYAAFRRLVVEKFGAPHGQATQTYTTGAGAGATITGERLTWRWPETSATLIERCGTVTELCLSVTTPALEVQRAEQKRRLEIQRAEQERQRAEQERRDHEKAKRSF